MLSGQLCRLGESTGFDVPHRGLAEEAFVLAVELARAFLPDFECRTGCIQPLCEHALARGNQSKRFLILQGAIAVKARK